MKYSKEEMGRVLRSALEKTSQGVFRRPVTVLHILEAADTLKADKY